MAFADLSDLVAARQDPCELVAIARLAGPQLDELLELLLTLVRFVRTEIERREHLLQLRRGRDAAHRVADE